MNLQDWTSLGALVIGARGAVTGTIGLVQAHKSSRQ